MKASNLIKTAVGMMVMALGLQAYAGPSSADFNSMIEENNATQRALTQKLNHELKTEKLDQHQNPNFNKMGKEMVNTAAPENVVVATGSDETVTYKEPVKKDALEKQNFKRLSQELKDIKE